MAARRATATLLALALLLTAPPTEGIGAQLSNCDASGAINLPVTSVADISARLAYGAATQPAHD